MWGLVLTVMAVAGEPPLEGRWSALSAPLGSYGSQSECEARAVVARRVFAAANPGRRFSMSCGDARLAPTAVKVP